MKSMMERTVKLSIVRDRQKEIEVYIQNDNLDMATKRTMDFVTDFSEDKNKRREVINIRAMYSILRREYRQLGTTKEIENRFITLRSHILEFLDEVEGEFHLKNNRTKSNDFSEKEKIIEKTINLTGYEKDKETFKKEKGSSFLSEKNNEGVVFRSDNIEKSYNSKSIKFSFKAMNLDLVYGDITALVGKNGNGKSTLLNMIAGELLQSSGAIEYPELGENNKWYGIKTEIAYIKQELPSWQGFLKDNLHFTLGVNGVKGSNNIDEVNFIIHRLGLEKYSEAKWSEISGGFKMRFSLARAILRKPKLLILDEPLANLDINTQNLFLSDLRDLANSLKHKMSVIVSSQNLYEIEEISDNIIFINNGEAIYNGKIKDFGLDRTDNSYEINIDASEDILLSTLESIDYINIKKDGKNYIINTSRSVSERELLGVFLVKKVRIKYFRDISRSTRKLFEEIR